MLFYWLLLALGIFGALVSFRPGSGCAWPFIAAICLAVSIAKLGGM